MANYEIVFQWNFMKRNVGSLRFPVIVSRYSGVELEAEG